MVLRRSHLGWWGLGRRRIGWQHLDRWSGFSGRGLCETCARCPDVLQSQPAGHLGVLHGGIAADHMARLHHCASRRSPGNEPVLGSRPGENGRVDHHACRSHRSDFRRWKWRQVCVNRRLHRTLRGRCSESGSGTAPSGVGGAGVTSPVPVRSGAGGDHVAASNELVLLGRKHHIGRGRLERGDRHPLGWFRHRDASTTISSAASESARSFSTCTVSPRSTRTGRRR